MLPPISIFFDKKKILREQMKAERNRAFEARSDAPEHAARNFMQAIAPSPGTVVALYAPIQTELETWPLIEALIEKGAVIALPVIIMKKAPLIFRQFTPGDDLVDGAYGVKTPVDAAPVLRPDTIVSPLLGFTRTGGRLGYGGGFYDRTLETLRTSGSLTAVGYAYGAQEVDALPLSDLDQPLDWIITEREAIRC